MCQLDVGGEVGVDPEGHEWKTKEGEGALPPTCEVLIGGSVRGTEDGGEEALSGDTSDPQGLRDRGDAGHGTHSLPKPP